MENLLLSCDNGFHYYLMAWTNSTVRQPDIWCSATLTKSNCLMICLRQCWKHFFPRSFSQKTFSDKLFWRAFLFFLIQLQCILVLYVQLTVNQHWLVQDSYSKQVSRITWTNDDQVDCCIYVSPGLFQKWLLSLNTLRPRQNGCHVTDNIFKCIFLNGNVWIPIEFSLKFVPKGPINNIPSFQWWLVQWRIYASLGLNELNLRVLIISPL